MSEKYKFQAVLKTSGPGTYVTIPFDVEQVFGKKRIKVKSVIAGIPYRGSIIRMGGEDYVLGVMKDIRAAAGISAGDTIEVEFEEDTDMREVEIPHDLQLLFAEHSAAEAFFQQLSYTHQKEYVRWITEAKKAETRQARLEKTVLLLEQHKKEHSSV